MQPRLELTEEPFRCQLTRKANQIAALERTLEIAKANDHGAHRTHFTIIPEYSIPGLEGIATIESVLRDADWPAGTVVIGGTDSLPKADYAALCGEASTYIDIPHNGPDHVQDNEWVNCCITWVKAPDGQLSRWLQPKIMPAWPEQNVVHVPMFRGNSVFLFRGAFENEVPARFFSLLCYDWVVTVAGEEVEQIPRQVLTRINALQQELWLSWVFVPQNNPKPSHTTFLTETANFFQNQGAWPFVFRGRCSVVFANTAGLSKPGRTSSNGCTGLIFSPGAPFDMNGCHFSYSGKPSIFRNSDALGQCCDVVFREKGACIHSFSQYLPGIVNLGAGGRTLPLHRANVHPIPGESDDPRARGTQVSGCIKWVNDALDTLPCLSQQLPDAPLANAIGAPHSENIVAFRSVESVHLEEKITYATWRKLDESPSASLPTADDWNDDQMHGLTHVIHTLDILRMGNAGIELTSTASHATANIRTRSVEVLAVNGPTHEECDKHIKARFAAPLHRQLLVITRDALNTTRGKKERSLLSTGAKAVLGTEKKITDTESSQIHLAFNDVMSSYIASESPAQLEESLYAKLA